ncbi:MAG: hypothetical protein U0798_21060 [Gemmataceae bacterium]
MSKHKHIKPKRVVVKCPACRKKDFEIRAIKDEGIATLKCIACNKNYLLLDSDDYWFDTIQNGYPRVRKCSCKSTTFGLACEYDFREDGDVRSVDVHTQCTACTKQSRLLDVDIDYGGTDHLVKKPLTRCENPKILYDLREFTMFAIPADIIRVLEFLSSKFNCLFTCQVRVKDKWVLRHSSLKETSSLVLQHNQSSGQAYYSEIYAHRDRIHFSETDVDNHKKEDVFWKRHEVIRFSSPFGMILNNATSLLYYINLSNEYIDDQTITPKSNEFVTMTKHLQEWLKKEFVSWRGKHCFDNPDENIRAFGDRFKKKK